MGGHVTVGELFERVHSRFPAIDRSTVYRAMDFFEELGLVCSADVAGVTVYEIARAEGSHQHLVCSDCGDVAHVPGETFEELADQLAAAYGFAADLDRLTISGRCRECAAAAAP
jgi:Fe2+ or Zn2+ uptake regulation protein